MKVYNNDGRKWLTGCSSYDVTYTRDSRTVCQLTNEDG